jgi:hypothetical protein
MCAERRVLHIIGYGKGSAERRTAAKFNQYHARGVNQPALLSVMDRRFGNEGGDQPFSLLT